MSKPFACLSSSAACGSCVYLCVCRREQELLAELDDRIEACQAKIHFNEQQIIAIAPQNLRAAQAPAEPLEPVHEGTEEEEEEDAKNNTFVSSISTLSDLDRITECAWKERLLFCAVHCVALLCL